MRPATKVRRMRTPREATVYRPRPVRDYQHTA